MFNSTSSNFFFTILCNIFSQIFFFISEAVEYDGSRDVGDRIV